MYMITYTFSVARESTPYEMFQVRELICDFNNVKSLSTLCLSCLNGSFTTIEVFPEVCDQEDSFDTLLKIHQ
jgi:hypothetical protein